MTETTTGSTPASDPSTGERAAAGNRHDRFDEALERLGHRTSRDDRRTVVAAAVVMAAGIVVAIVAYVSSTGQSDTRDVISSVILALVGLSLVVGGAALFVRSSLIEFLRFWMLRLLYEQQRARDDG